MKFCKRVPIVLALLTLVVTACEKSSNTVVSMPNIRVGCSTGNSTNCSNANPQPSLTGFVRLSRSGCGSSLQFDPVATGSVVLSCDVLGCDGTVSTWINPSTSEPVTEIITGSIYICAQMDLDNSSGLPNSGDLINEELRRITGSELLTIDTWSTKL